MHVIRPTTSEADRDAQMNQIVENARLNMTWHEIVAIANDRTIAGRDERIAAVVMSAANRVRSGILNQVDPGVHYERVHHLGLIAEIANAHFEVN